jgi:hypothetical protein
MKELQNILNQENENEVDDEDDFIEDNNKKL